MQPADNFLYKLNPQQSFSSSIAHPSSTHPKSENRMQMASRSSKFLALAAFLVLLSMSMVHGAIYRTVVTTTETITDDERGSEEQRCREEMKKHSLGACRRYMRQQEEVALTMGNQQMQRVPQECCEKMRNVRDDCMCYVLKRMVEEEQEEGQGQGTRGEILRRAQQIPSQCQLKTRGCDIGSAAV